MKKYLLTLATIIFSLHISAAQNLVNNGGFEQYDTCFEAFDNIHLCTGWQNGNGASADYFNACATGILADVPQNFFGYQFASEGNGYAGIITYEVGNADYSEYILGNVQQLTPGHSYQVSLKVSRADTCALAANGIGTFFYVDNIGVNDPMTTQRLDLEPQIKFQSYSAITDTAGWTTLTDTLIADSAYKHIVIGRFTAPSELDSIRTTSNLIFNHSYYYIDEVNIIDLTPTNVSSVNTTVHVSSSPNPFINSTKLTFKNSQQKKHCLRIFDIEGRFVRKVENITREEVIVERHDLNPGCYFYELKSEDGAVAKGKLFVQ